MLIRKIIIVLVFLVIFSSFVSAVIQYSTSTDHFPFNIRHGEQTTFQITLTNKNSVCNMVCSYDLLNTNTGQEEEKTVTITTSTPYTYSKILTVPDYSTTLVTYNLVFQCSDSPSCLFVSKDPLKTYDIDVTPKLNDAEVSAKFYIESNLKNNEGKLTEISNSLQKLNNKINNLKTNVKIGNIKNDYNSYNTKFDSVNYNVQKVDSLYGTAHYIESQNTFDLNQFNSLLGITTNIETLSTQIDDIVKRHNEVAEKIEKLNDLMNSNQKLASAVDKQQEFNNLQSDVKLLANNFNNGDFNSYDEIDDSVNSYTNKINDFKSKWSQLLTDILTNGNGVLDEESSILCQNKAICTFGKVSLLNDIKDLDNICGAITSIGFKFDEIFKEEFSKYDLSLKNLTEVNEQIKKENEKISLENEELENENTEIKNLNTDIKNLNDLSGELNMIIKESHIEIDTKKCSDSINQLQLNNTLEIINSAISECTQLKSSASSIKTEKEKSFVFKFKKLFFFFSSFDFYKLPQVDAIPVKNLLSLKEELKITIEAPIKLKFKDGTLNFQTKYCNIKEIIEKLSLDKSQSTDAGDIDEQITLSFKEQDEQCCWLGTCKTCCKGDECRNDEKSYPTIFIHGHSFKSWDSPDYSLAAFDKIQLYLIQNGYVIRGILLPTDDDKVIPKGSWGKSNQPSTVKVTYYLNTYNKDGQIVNQPSKEDSIETYAARLDRLIKLTKDATNREKVNIIAHSMGGLVAREYIKEFGGDSVNKLITIATPNHGVYGAVDSFCGVTGAAKECSQMSSYDKFIKNLNSGDETPYNVRYFTIAGSGCALGGNGDGISLVDSVKLGGAENIEIPGKCEWDYSGIPNQRAFHSNLLNPDKYPDVLDSIKKILTE